MPLDKSVLNYIDQTYGIPATIEPPDTDEITPAGTQRRDFGAGRGIGDRREVLPLPGEKEPAPQSDVSRLPSRGFTEDILASFAQGTLDLGETGGNALQTVGAITGSEIIDRLGEKMVDFVSKTAEKHPDLFLQSQEAIEAQPNEAGKGIGGFRHWTTAGVRAAVTSLGASLPGGLAGAALGGPWGAIAGFATSGGTIFGLAEYNRFMDEGEAAGIPKEVLQNKAVISAFVEGGFEGLANAVEAGVFKFMRPATRSILGSLAKKRVKQTIGDLAKRLALTMPVEIGTEVSQEFIEAKLRQDIGIPTVDPVVAAKSAVGPAAVVTLLFGIGSMNLAQAQRRKLENTLADPDNTPEERMKAADKVEAELNRQDRSGETGSQWHDLVDEMIVDGEPVIMDETLLEIEEVREAMQRVNDSTREEFDEVLDTEVLPEGQVIPAPGEIEEEPVVGEEILPEGQVIPAPELVRPPRAEGLPDIDITEDQTPQNVSELWDEYVGRSVEVREENNKRIEEITAEVSELKGQKGKDVIVRRRDLKRERTDLRGQANDVTFYAQDAIRQSVDAMGAQFGTVLREKYGIEDEDQIKSILNKLDAAITAPDSPNWNVKFGDMLDTFAKEVTGEEVTPPEAEVTPPVEPIEEVPIEPVAKPPEEPPVAPVVTPPVKPPGPTREEIDVKLEQKRQKVFATNKVKIAKAPAGKKVKVKTQSGIEVDFRYKIVDLFDLIVSHLPKDFKKNPIYPQEKQPRQRERQASQLTVNEIKQDLQPEKLGVNVLPQHGAPWVDESGVTEGGNGRLIALMQLAKDKPEEFNKYKDWLKENAESDFNLKQSDVETMKFPVVVRERTTSLEGEELKKFIDDLNAPEVAILGETEKAANDAKRLTPQILASFRPSEEGLIDTVENQDFIRAFFGSLPKTERDAYVGKNNKINAAGRRRIKQALFAKAFGDAEIVDTLAEAGDEANIKNILNAMTAATADIIKTQRGIENKTLKPLDISADIASAAVKMEALRKTNKDVDTYLKQIDLLDPELSPEAKEILKIFNNHKRSGRRIAQFIKNYQEFVAKQGNPSQEDIFAAEETDKPNVGKLTLINAAAEAMEVENEGPQIDDQTGLFPAPGKPVEGKAPGKRLIKRPPAEGVKKPPEKPKVKKALPKQPKPKRPRKPSQTLALIPRHLQAPTESVEFKEEHGKLVKRSNIVAELAAGLGVAIRSGKVKGKPIAIYKVGRQIIRWKVLNGVFHEAGHFLSETMPGVWKEKVPQSEIDPLLREYGKRPADVADEAWSEFLKFWVINPAKARALAPEFSNYFKQAIKKHPEIEAILKAARADFTRFRQLGPSARIASQVSMKDRKGRLRHRIVNKLDDMYANVFDDKLVFKQAIDILKAEGLTIPDEENFYMLSRVHKGIISKANVFFEKGTTNRVFWRRDGKKIKLVFKGKSLRSILAPIAKTNSMQDFIIYLVSRRAMELSRRNILTGIELDDAKKAKREQEAKHPDFVKAAEDLYQFQDDVLEYGFQSGLYTEKMMGEMRKLNREYVPFYRVIEEMEKSGMMGKSLSDVSRVVKRIKGSELDILNPLESIMRNTYAIMNSADSNMIGVTMANWANQSTEFGKMFEKIDTPLDKVASVKLEDLGLTPEKVFGEDDISEDRLDLFERIFDIFRPSAIAPSGNVISVLINGKKQYYEVDPAIYKAMTSTDAEATNWVIKMLSYPTRTLRAGAILTPEFMMKNPARDTISAYVYSNYGFLPIRDHIKSVSALLGKTDEYWLWRLGGGDHSMMVSLDRKYLTKSFDEIVQQHNFTDYVNIMDVLRKGSELSEKINRLPEAILALRAGKSPITAAFAAREVTLDFAKGGHVGRSLNMIIAFWKAWALGWEKMILEFKNKPTQMATKVTIGITLPSVILWMVNHDDPRWKEIPQWQKDLFWIVMTKDKIWRIPKPFELGILFGSTVERYLDYLDSKDPEGMKQLAKNLFWTQAPGIFPTGL